MSKPQLKSFELDQIFDEGNVGIIDNVDLASARRPNRENADLSLSAIVNAGLEKGDMSDAGDIIGYTLLRAYQLSESQKADLIAGVAHGLAIANDHP